MPRIESTAHDLEEAQQVEFVTAPAQIEIYEALEDPTQTPAVGRRVPRPDTLPQVLGQLKYIDDLSFPGMLHAKVLRSQHPTVASDDYAELFERGCTSSGLQCLPVKEIAVQVERSPVEYRFMVTFMDHDGSILVRPQSPEGDTSSDAPSREQFAYTVLKVDDRFLVQELPVYVP